MCEVALLDCGLTDDTMPLSAAYWSEWVEYLLLDDGNAGFPTAERAIRGSTNIETLSDEDQELLRVACKAILLSLFADLMTSRCSQE